MSSHTSIHKSVRMGKILEVKALLSEGVDINMQDEHRRSPLHIAAWLGDIEMVRLLLDHGASATAPAMDNFTALHFSAQCLRESAGECVVLLAEKMGKHKIDTRVFKGNKTALHLAAAKNNFHVAARLLELGADPLALTSAGQTPISLAQDPNIRQLIQAAIDNKVSNKQIRRETNRKNDQSLNFPNNEEMEAEREVDRCDDLKESGGKGARLDESFEVMPTGGNERIASEPVAQDGVFIAEGGKRSRDALIDTTITSDPPINVEDVVKVNMGGRKRKKTVVLSHLIHDEEDD